MNGYKCFYGGKTCEVHAATSYAAVVESAKIFKVKEKHQHKISVFLCEKAGEPVTTDVAQLPGA